ncbi:PKD domain-containing protein [Flavihumibacter profundi]|uniref:PKD domain-containing protein n=1 Tax=Flavihumibacter profundi TaxID=2716883 RepID=UPI001CC46B9C|nr:heparin lyase I family protein [Flavihumibacter profundi]MBZ5855641.1 heparin lyase I family protein [Flavihumibacter profundi]
MEKKLFTALPHAMTIISLLFVCTNIAYSQSNFVLNEDFEGNGLSKAWDFNQSCCSYSFTESNVFKRTGNQSLRVELRKSDNMVAYGKRAELIENTYPFPPDTNREWWAFSTYFPDDFQRDSVSEGLAQWQFYATGATQVAGSPPLTFMVSKGDFVIDLRYDSVDINLDNGANIKRQVFNLGPWNKNGWNDWIFQYHFSADNDGFLKVWKNGVLVLDYKGKNFYRGSYPPYFKLGLYKWVWNTGWNVPAEVSVLTSRVYYIDNVKIGNKQAILKDFLIPSVLPANILPIADAGNNQLANFPVTYATINGTNSYDPDGRIVSYKWTQESGPNVATMWADSAPVNKVTNLVTGMYTFRLTVMDSLGGTSFSLVNVECKNNGIVNANPVAKVGSTIEISQPVNSASLSGTGSFDTDGSVVSYKWTQDAGPSIASIDAPDNQNTTISNLTKGNYYFKLTVKDNGGGIGVGYVQVYVNGISPSDTGNINLPPIAVVGKDQYITSPQTFATLDGSSSYDPDGTVVKYVWVQLTGPKSSPMTTPAASQTNVTGLLEGTYTYRLYITDNKGLAGISPIITVVVGPPIKPKLPNFSPVLVMADQNPTVTLPTNTVTLDASASYDPDGTIVRYSWVQLDGPKAAPMTAPSSPVTSINWLIAGTYTYKLYMTDDSLATTISPVITVNVLPAVTGAVNRGSALETDHDILATLSGNAIGMKKGLTVYPNPVVNEFEVVLNNEYTGSGEIRIFDNQGRLIAKDAFIKEYGILRRRIQLSGFASGQYLMDIRVGNNYQATKKLIKK